MKKLPDIGFSEESITTRKEAVDTVDNIIQQNAEMAAIYDQLQPLLYALSVKLYGDDDKTIILQKLIQDSVEWIESGTLPITYKELQ